MTYNALQSLGTRRTIRKCNGGNKGQVGRRTSKDVIKLHIVWKEKRKCKACRYGVCLNKGTGNVNLFLLHWYLLGFLHSSRSQQKINDLDGPCLAVLIFIFNSVLWSIRSGGRTLEICFSSCRWKFSNKPLLDEAS